MKVLLRGVQFGAVALAAMMAQTGAVALPVAHLAAALLLAVLPLILFTLALAGGFGRRGEMAATLFGIIAAIVINPSLLLPELWRLVEISGTSGSVASLVLVQGGLILAAAAMAQRASIRMAGTTA